MKRIWSFRHWPILPKILTISLLSVLFISGVILFRFAPHIQAKMLEEKKDGLRNVLDVAFSILQEQQALAQNGQITLAEAQSRAAQKIGALTYGEHEYFWINDLRARMIMHPVMPELDGQDMSNTRDPNGKYVFREFVRVARSSGSGAVEYLWPKPGESTPVPKMSCIKLYEPWGWIVGTGIYTDDLQKDMARLRLSLVTGIVIFTVVTFMLALAIGTGITGPLKKVITGLQEIAGGKGDIVLDKRIAITSIDEIGLLSSEFNRLMESISNLTLFKKVIEEEDSVEDVYRRLGEVFSNQLSLTCRIYDFGLDQRRMTAVHSLGAERPEGPCEPASLDNCERCKARRTGHTISSLHYPSICRHFQDEGIDNHCIPIMVGGGAVGVVQLLLERNPGGRTEEHERRILKAEQYIKESLPVIETKRLMTSLRESSLRDSLTGLHNRRFLHEHMDATVAGALRRGKGVGLIMCDLDHFKQVNDSHGHDVGDLVLKEAARTISRSVRQSDIVIRFGGEEFLVILLDVGDEEAMTVAEKIRQRIQSARVRIPNGTLHKTMSLGISVYPTDSDSFWHSIKFADVALYKAKELGRNRTVRFSAEMWTEEQAS